MCITLYDVLHLLHVVRGTRTDIPELKITQDLDRIDQYPIFLVLLDLHKAYNTLDWDHL